MGLSSCMKWLPGAGFACMIAANVTIQQLRRIVVSAQQMYKSPLHKMTSITKTALWNDSCSIEELTYAIDNGAVGATANPVIVVDVLKKEMQSWKDRIGAMIREMPKASEEEVAWKVVEEMSAKGAALLKPIYDHYKGWNGRLSIQTDPKYYRDGERIVQQALHFETLAPNMIIKIPVTKAGIWAIEEVIYHGASINATVCFTVPQAIAVAEAVERGLKRREKEGKDISRMGPVCTIMVGRTDDWLKVVAEKEGIITDPSHLEWAGVAVFKKAYQIYRKKGYRLRLLSAAYRNHMQWSEFIGGDVVLSIPYKWQKRFNASDIEVVERMDRPVDKKILDDLLSRFKEFRKAYEEDGLKVEEFDDYGATRRTLRQFLQSTQDLVKAIRDFMIPNPDA
jgi:transaldolase